MSGQKGSEFKQKDLNDAPCVQVHFSATFSVRSLAMYRFPSGVFVFTLVKAWKAPLHLLSKPHIWQ